MGCVSLVWVLVWVLYFRDLPRTHPAITTEGSSVWPSAARALKARRRGSTRVKRRAARIGQTLGSLS